jgi:acetate kinase
MEILTLNAGSSTIKFSVFSTDGNELSKRYVGLIDLIAKKSIMQITDCLTQEKHQYDINISKTDQSEKKSYNKAIQAILDWLKNQNIELIAAGSRMIHGCTRFKSSIAIDNDLLNYLETLSPLAPLHQPYNIMGCRILREVFPQLFQIVCFDTLFHTSCNQISQMFALPQKYTKEGIHRYGFHGLSYEYVVSQFASQLKERADGKIIIMHLGNGASMCAVNKKHSVATSIGFSALDGLMMGTRCGSIDAGVLLYLMKNYAMDYHALTHLLYRESGLLGVSGISSDMRDLLASDSEHAKLAVDLYIYRIAQWIGTLSMELNGLDGLVFTAGIGENSSYIREEIGKKARWLGVKIDPEKNQANAIEISTKDSKIGVYVIPTDEEITIAKHTLKLWKEH